MLSSDEPFMTPNYIPFTFNLGPVFFFGVCKVEKYLKCQYS